MYLIKSHGMYVEGREGQELTSRNSHICLHLAMKLAVHLTNMNIKLNAPYHTALGRRRASLPVRGLFASKGPTGSGSSAHRSRAAALAFVTTRIKKDASGYHLN
jgi:hypothetical protein